MPAVETQRNPRLSRRSTSRRSGAVRTELADQVDRGSQLLDAGRHRATLAAVVSGSGVALDGGGESTGGMEVGGDGAPGDVGAPLASGAQGVADSAVHGCTLLAWLELVGDVTDERVTERVDIVALFVEEAPVEQRSQAAVDQLGPARRHIAEHVTGEHPADRRRGLGDADVGARGVEPGEQGLVQRAGDSRLVPEPGQELGVDGHRSHRLPRQLLDEERVALAARERTGETIALDAVVDRASEHGRLVARQRVEVDGDETGAVEAAVPTSFGRHQLHAVDGRTDETGEQLEGRPVGPVHVLDQQDQR